MVTSNLEWGDYLSLAGYFAIVIGFGIWSSCKNRGSVGGYFLAGRSMHWIPVGASLFASNIGSGHFIGLAGSGSSLGIGSAGFEINALFTLIFLGWIFLPVYIRAGVYTMPEYIKKRFGGDRIRIYLSCLSLILYIFTKISADLYSGAIFIQQSINLNLYVSVVILLVIAAVFTIGGGLTAVIWTDFIQTIIMLIGAFYLMITGFLKVGGYETMVKEFGYAVPNTTLYSNSTKGIPTKDYLDLVRSPTSEYPWPGMLFGALISSIWYWCTDQVIVQRALAAKNISHARAGCLLAGLLKFLPLFLIFYPGMVSRILYKDEIACVDENVCKEFCQNDNGCSNVAYPTLVIRLMPVGARGLMLAVMMAALMSSLTSIFNSASTLFTMDIYKRIRVNAKDWELMIVGRVFVLVLVGVSIIWIPVIQGSQNSRLFDYIQSITSFLAPPVGAVFLNAVFFKRINETGAFWSLMIGLAVGMTRFILEFTIPDSPVVKSVHYLHFGILLFGISTISLWTISLWTKPIPKKYIKRMTYFTINDPNGPIPIPAGKGCGTGNFCAGANLDNLSDDTEIITVGNINEAFEKEANKVHITDDKNLPEKKEVTGDIAAPVAQKLHPLKRALYFICGIETLANQTDEEQKQQLEVEMDVSIDQDPFWARIINIVAILIAAGAGFFIAFFNKYD